MSGADLVPVTQDSIKEALIEARGDLFTASQSLSITAIRMDRAIQVSPMLQQVVAELWNARKDPAYERASSQELQILVDRRLALYRVVGLDSLAELATMPIDANSAQNQVRLAAAARLAGSTEGAGGGGEVGDILRQLNEAYQASAPRIRLTREKLTVEVSQGAAGIPVDAQSPRRS